MAAHKIKRKSKSRTNERKSTEKKLFTNTNSLSVLIITTELKGINFIKGTNMKQLIVAKELKEVGRKKFNEKV